MKQLGLDPGVNTGFALTDEAGRLIRVETLPIDVAMQEAVQLFAAGHLTQVVFEDARQRTWFGEADKRQEKGGAGVREGVGSVKRDCSIWEGFLARQGIPFKAVKPQTGATKTEAKYFERLTGWKGRTSEHARDAAMLVFQRRCA